MKLTQKQLIINQLKVIGGWIAAFKLQSVETIDGNWIGSSGSRRCRELYEAGLIERRLNGRYVEYKYKPEVKEVIKVVGNRTVDRLEI